MLFNSLRFLAFFPCVVLVYFLLPRKVRWYWLLVTSYVFYMGWNAAYALLLATSTVLTYLCGLALGAVGQRGGGGRKATLQKRGILAACLVANLAILFFFKYYDFATESITAVMGFFGAAYTPPAFDVLLPVGISFYTFQAIGYTIDVYRKDITPERNLFRYALFVSFFPQLVAGPIERSRNILPQLSVPHDFSFERLRSGLLLMLWGYFQKMVVADRLSTFVTGAFDGYATQGKLALLTALVFFAFQIYCDFASYSNIAIGTAHILGIELMQNFNAPYLSRNIQDFWRRWHISLSTWFRDYVYFPLGGSRHGRLRTALNTMVVFLLSGLWHGANWTFVLWGLLHGGYLVLGQNTREARKRLYAKLHLRHDAWYAVAWQTFFTFALVCFTYVFFRADTLSVAFGYLSQVATGPLHAPGFFELGMDAPDFIVSLLGIAAVFTADILSQKTSVLKNIDTGSAPLRWTASLIGIAVILVFGIYGEGFVEKPFIYFQF
ncbi:MBOAT family protein [Ruminococcaceae bacterium OttesenSCG-928-I18]|nr:MBOAT family protein [Ruminococcaceae bacterium OttesenSCG-928-I18]